MGKGNDSDLDDILDDALDAIDNEDDSGNVQKSKSQDLSSAAKAAATATAAAAEESAAAAATKEGDESLESSLEKLMSEMQNPEFMQSLDQAFKMLNMGEGDADGAKAFESLLSAAGEGDEDMAKTIEQLAAAAKGLESANPEEAEVMGEEIMKEMMKQFEKMGKKDDFQQHVDNMMKQLVSKDVMYTPMKQVCDKFPQWLEDNKSKLEKAEYERYEKQYDYFQKIIGLYDSEPENFTKLMELMQEMQEYGQPPLEIIKDLAPGMEFGEDGMPRLDGFPGMPGGNPAQNCPQM